MFFLKKYELKECKRDFTPYYLFNKEQQEHFNQFGYVVLKDVISEAQLNLAKNEFELIQQKEGYLIKDNFESTGNFISRDLQEYIFKFIEKYMYDCFKEHVDFNNCEIGKGGAFFIKPNTDKSKLEPHQDSPVIDESVNYAMFAWIPLQDITEANGALYLLPKSHLWGNFYRSQHIPWAFGNICKELWKHMIPIYIKKGDVILFDPSIIHSSEINRSSTFRIVVCGALLPKNHQKVEYIAENKVIKKYFIDNEYWLNGGMQSSLKNYTFEIINHDYPKTVKYSMINHLVQLN